MKVTTEFRRGRLTVWLNGELDHHAAREVIGTICDEIDDCLPSSCILDFKGVGFMDSSGIAVILKSYKRMRELGGSLLILNASKQAMRVLEMSGIGKFISTEEIKA